MTKSEKLWGAALIALLTVTFLLDNLYCSGVMG